LPTFCFPTTIDHFRLEKTFNATNLSDRVWSGVAGPEELDAVSAAADKDEPAAAGGSREVS
jgi:hypothetical protein